MKHENKTILTWEKGGSDGVMVPGTVSIYTGTSGFTFPMFDTSRDFFFHPETNTKAFKNESADAEKSQPTHPYTCHQ